ncbi:hypothetical protein OESDEN_00775 [Oesophagostomum dentatum]|uniref:Uncharacterized protein n=1 Tax=Oesophagostomum dentatum TaxID=61180 RepID=A0A0B1TNX6_OESDE|nr:hypothetical protein OESDEN_00775 [Oesophagostomum dentatum]
MALPVPSLIGVIMALLMDIFGALNLLVSPVDDVITFVMKSGMSGGVLNLPNFILERVAATILVAKYEQCNENFPFFASAMILTQIGTVIFLVYLHMIGFISELEGVIAFGVTCIVSVLLFCLLPLVSRRAYARHLRKGSGVSVRYQTAENMRAASLLNKLMVLYACFFFAENFYYYVIMFVLKLEDVALHEALLTLFYAFITLEIFATTTAIALSHPSLKTALRFPKQIAMFKDQRSNRVCVEVTSSTNFERCASGTDVRALDGRQLLFSLEQEKEIYFKNYAVMWNK